MRVRSVRLTGWHERAAKRFGNGEISEGVRYALELAHREMKKEKR